MRGRVRVGVGVGVGVRVKVGVRVGVGVRVMVSRLRGRPLVILADDGLAQRAVPVALGHVGLAQRWYEALEMEDTRTRVTAEELAELAAVVAVRVVRILLVILF